MITLALGMVLWGLSYRWIPVTGGDNGISGIPSLLERTPGCRLPEGRRLLLRRRCWSLRCRALLMATARAVAVRPDAARHPRERRPDEEPRLQHLAALLPELTSSSGAFASVAGVMWAYYNGFVSPTYLDLTASSELFLMVTLGGPATLIGPVLGAGAIVLLKNVMSAYTARWLFILGIVYIVTILAAPQGLWNLGDDDGAAIRREVRGCDVATARRASVRWLRRQRPASAGPRSCRLALVVLAIVAAAGLVRRSGRQRPDQDRLHRAAVGRRSRRTGATSSTVSCCSWRRSATAPAAVEIQLIVEDDEGIPAVGLTKARKLVERDRVHLMAGTLLSSTGVRARAVHRLEQIPMVYPVVSADDLTQRRRSRWIVRTGWTEQPAESCVRRVRVSHAEATGRVATIALDYAFGWESVGGFQRTFEAEGGRMTQKMWTPVSVHDFAPYLAQISRDVDAVYALFLGRTALQFMRQYAGVRTEGARARSSVPGRRPTSTCCRSWVTRRSA